MGTPDYKWVKFKNGIGYVAIVNMEVVPNPAGKNEIIECYPGKIFNSEGYVEQFPPHKPWKLAARLGLEYAFSFVDTNWKVSMTKIVGSNVDTNSTIVGYTVMRAFFDRINFKLDEKKIILLEDFVLSSWKKSYKELIPNFFNLTFSEYNPDK